MTRDFDKGRLKDYIIYNVLQLLKNDDYKLKQDTKTKLKELAKFYRINLNKVKYKMNLEKALEAFILNKKGYRVTIINLYCAL